MTSNHVHHQQNLIPNITSCTDLPIELEQFAHVKAFPTVSPQKSPKKENMLTLLLYNTILFNFIVLSVNKFKVKKDKSGRKRG